MPLNIQQTSKYCGDDRWEWSVRLKGPKKDLDEVDRVIYQLHPTFSRPVVEIDSRESDFRLDSSGWGVFRLYAKVIFKDERPPLKLHHDLKLKYPNGKAVTA